MLSKRILGIVGAVVVIVGGFAYLLIHPMTTPTASADSAQSEWETIRPGDNVTLDMTILLHGEAWKTTAPWAARLMSHEFNTTYNESSYVPWHVVAGDPDPNANPVEAVLAETLVGRHYGEHYSFRAFDLFGPKSDVVNVSVPRFFGPYNRTTTYDRATFEERFGNPSVGETVATNRLFNSTVVAVNETQVTTETQALDGSLVALPRIEAMLKVENTDSSHLRLELQPLANVSFKVANGEGYFGMADGLYAFATLNDTAVFYHYHPRYSPFLVGESFDILVDTYPTMQQKSTN